MTTPRTSKATRHNPKAASDAKPANASLENFSHQLEHDAQMESDTRVPPVDTLVGQR